MATGHCESCGDEGVEIGSVRRLYVTPEAWDTPGRVTVGADERWCFVCRTHYPHHELGPDGEIVEHELGWPDEVPPA